jgi:cellulose synthase/poly-beta-1,6-N-acetylglucosamine synthase-like glycosyltransferase
MFVVLAFGESPFLAGCLESLRAQWLPSAVVIVTSTPSDFIAAVAREANVEVIVNPERKTIAADWNFALGVADHRYATLAHQDDAYAPDFVAQTLAAFAGDSVGVLCFTGYQEIDEAGRAKSSKISRVKHLIEMVTLGRSRAVSGPRLRAYLSFGNPLPCSSVTFDTKKLRGFRFSSEYASNLDWDAWWRLMEDGATFLRTPDRLVGRRHNILTATAGLKRDGTRAAEDLIMFRRAWPRPIADAIATVYRWAG